MATPNVRRRGRLSLIIGTLLASMALTAVALASDVDTAVVDTDAPTGSVSLAAGGEAPIMIRLTVSGRQVNPATLKIYKSWTLSGGAFTGTDEETVNVATRATGVPADIYTVNGTVKVDAGQAAGGPFTLAIKPHAVTTTAPAALAIGDASNYQVTVTAPPPPSDTTPPDISYVLDPASPDGNNGWYASDVTLTWTVTEDESPDSLVKTGCVDQSITVDQAETTYSCSATSDGGSADQVDVKIKRDATKPSISGSASPVANSNGWNNTDVAVSFTCGDNLSGVASCGPNATLSSEGAGQSVTGTAVDNAGNSDSASVSNINIDKTDPDVSLVGGPAGGASYYFGSVPAAPTCSASDALSGLDGACGVSGYSTAVGEHTVIATATDNADNEGSDGATYTVLAWTLSGFYQPVDMSGVWNTVKNGSTVPLKFEIFAGSTELTDTSLVNQPLKATQTPCSGGTTDDVELLSSGSTTLRYDSTAGQFIYNWQTPKKAGYCYVVTVTTADGSAISASFKLK